MRADQTLVARGLARSRTVAQAMIAAGRVAWLSAAGRVIVTRPSQDIAAHIELVVEASDDDRFVSRGGLKLHLSEHSGDASPGATAVCYMKGVEAFQKGLIGKDYKYNRPGLEQQDWGLECQVIDPFGNRIRFMESQD